MSEFIGWFGTALEFVLLWRLVTWRAWRFYPVYFRFFLLILVRHLLMYYVLYTNALSLQEYSLWYWGSSVLVALFYFPVAWEAHQATFKRPTIVSQVAAFLLLGVLAGSALFILGSGLAAPRYITGLHGALSLAVALWMVCLVLLVRYYRLNPSLNAWGIAVGLGLFAATSVMNATAVELTDAWYAILRYARPLSFVAALLLWTWTLWVHRPPSSPDELAQPHHPPLTAIGNGLRKALRL